MFIPINVPSVITYPKLSLGISWLVIPNVLADTPSLSYEAVAIRALSPVAPYILTTFPLLIWAPDVFLTYIKMSWAFRELDAFVA